MSFQILNTKVIFNAQVTETVLGFDANLKQPGNLTFDQVDINIGNALNGSAGVFTAPIAGIYRMTFSDQSALDEIEKTQVTVTKNYRFFFRIFDSNEAWMMQLNVGDEVRLYAMQNLNPSYYYPLTFTGELIHID